MAVHGASLDEGTSMAALDLKPGKGAPVMWPPKNENLGRFSNSSLACKCWMILCLHFCLTIWHVVPQIYVASPCKFLHEQSSCLQELEIFVFAFFSDTSSLAVQCSVGTYVVASCVCISANFRVLFACGRGRVCAVLCGAGSFARTCTVLGGIFLPPD